MGLASSQARLLNLTARMHDIEYKAQNLEAQKLQMANESRQVYQEYENALNKQKVQFKRIVADGSAKYEDASIKTLIDAGYKIKVLNGSEWTTFDKMSGTKLARTTAAPAKATSSADLTDKVKALTDKAPGDIVNSDSAYFYITAVDEDGKPTDGYKIPSLTSDPKATNYTEKAAVGDIVEYDDKQYQIVTIDTDDTPKSWVELTTSATLIASGDLANIDVTDEETLRNMVEAGFIVFEKPMSDGTFSEVNIATDTSLQEVTDDVDLKKAEAKYEADMRKINAKDKKFDTDLAAMEAERNAIKTEMETLKSVAKDNVDRTYKLFG